MAPARSTSAVARSLWAGLGQFLRPASRASWRRRASALPVPGMPVLRPDAVGGSRCVACHLCVAACPSRCIDVAAGERDPSSAAWRRTASAFAIDVARCVFCGLCAEACPERALTMSAQRLGPDQKPLSHRSRDAQRLALQELLTGA